ncbi:selenocysteine-specific translation elongation factor [Candidatus Villigracilis affinis]|uniref:selenocysteine-specific translation elongation factor n=1 Tax=Candidatus Villigracilis affinis TaxID=3140682 RepID=UPI001D52CFCA|nr:selenocysteine-specific translation elongation factor [Anaerolineales bacterium]
MRVIGTAGHVDHGKSTLIAALTGTHPDRLKEEQAREMTIELGFGWMNLPNGEEVGIVDVPGHRDFIENMLSGIGGIDAALLVIAADEGVMPQTREHLLILDLLQIPAGLIVLTKTDLASDSGWLDLLETDIRSAVSETVLKDAPIVRVSAKNKTGLKELLSAIEILLKDKPSRPDLNRPRLPIDRVFSMSGFGTVVTGTLSDGHLSIGDEVEILPSGQTGRIRGLQTHKKKEESAVPGSRTAVNISGVNTDLIQRGEVVVHPHQYTATRRIDARFRLLKEVSKPIKHNDEVKFFTGASETVATLRLLGTEELQEGEEGWIQLELRDPIVAVRGDRYILRRPSPSETIGGGMIVDHQPKGRHKRFDETVLKSLESLAQGSPADVLFEAALALNAASLKEMTARSRLELNPANEALNELIADGRLVALEEGELSASSNILAITLPYWNSLREKTIQLVDAYHKQYPLRRGIPREELKSKLKLTPRVFNAAIGLLVNRAQLVDLRGSVAQTVHEIKFNGQDQARVNGLMRKFAENPFGPPSVKECQAEVGEEIFNALIEMNELFAVSPDVVFKKQDYELIVRKIREELEAKETITLAEVRDLLSTTRKYAQALLEHLDAINITMRDGDARKLRK